MDVSMTMPTMLAHDRAATLAWCRLVDDGPWPSLAVPERITYPSHDITVELAAAAQKKDSKGSWKALSNLNGSCSGCHVKFERFK